MTAKIKTASHAACAVLAGLVLAGCKEEKKPPAPAAVANTAVQKATDAAEQSIQSAAAAPGKIRFRGVQAYSQAVPERVAICGQVNPFADDANIFVPFVSVVTMQQKGQFTEYQFDQRIGTTTAEASRVYAAIVTYCYDKGGPVQALGRSVVATPPLPDTIPDPLAGAATARPVGNATPAKPATVPTEATGNVTVRQSANVRSDPHGPSVRTVPQGTSLRVFGQAPGGWYQVGDTAPFGWVHESMLDKR